MNRFLALILLAVSSNVSAEFYKTVDENGNVHYSSYPGKSSQLVELPGLSHGDPDSVDPATTGGSYREFIIQLPAAGAVVKNDQGSVPVSLTLNPALAAGHKIQVTLDNQPLPETLTGTHFTLQNVQAGSHQIQVSIHSESGAVLISAGPVSFAYQAFTATPPAEETHSVTP